MTGVTVNNRTFLDAILWEPIELVISQPHQALISSASVYLVAAEASMLIGAPWNVFMAVGAEWAYLRGLSSGQGVKTRWAAGLNWSAVLLVVLYGSLWGLRKFGVPLPSEGFQATDPASIAGAIVLTFIHIFAIGAVTLCSAMVHRTMLESDASERKALAERERERAERLQAERDAMELEAARKEQDLAYWVKAQQAKAVLKTTATSRAAVARPPCPVCGQELDSQDYALMRSAEKRQAKFRGCRTCRAP